MFSSLAELEEKRLWINSHLLVVVIITKYY